MSWSLLASKIYGRNSDVAPAGSPIQQAVSSLPAKGAPAISRALPKNVTGKTASIVSGIGLPRSSGGGIFGSNVIAAAVVPKSSATAAKLASEHARAQAARASKPAPAAPQEQVQGGNPLNNIAAAAVVPNQAAGRAEHAAAMAAKAAQARAPAPAARPTQQPAQRPAIAAAAVAKPAAPVQVNAATIRKANGQMESLL